MEPRQAATIVNVDAGTERRRGRRQRRQAALETHRTVETAARRRRLLAWGAGVLAALVALGALIYWLARPEPGPPIQTFPLQGQQHIQPGQSHPPYNSKPPTSGWHYVDPANWGIYTAPIPDEVQVHNLEHGGIMIQYDCPTGCPSDVARLESIVSSYRSKVILAPYPGIGHRIAATAWERLAYMETVDETFIRRFINRYKDQGPERVPD